MSFCLVSGVVTGVSKFFVRIQKWVMVKMSLNGKFHGSNGRLPGNCKLKKAKEPLRSPNCRRKWKGKVASLWILVLVIVGCVWFYWGSCGGFFVGKVELNSPNYCEDKARILIKQFNVSRDQLRALASLLCESDQAASLKCAKEIGTEILSINNFGHTLKALCCQNLGLLKEHMYEGEDANLGDQCPAQNENIPWRHDISMPEEKKIPHPEILFWSHYNQKYAEDVSQVRTGKRRIEEKCETSTFCLFRGFCWVIIGVIVSFKVVSRYRSKWRTNHNLNEVSAASVAQQRQLPLQQRQHQQTLPPPKGAGKWRKRILFIFVVLGTIFSFWLFYSYYKDFVLKREETLTNMCDERARMLQDQFNVSMNHVHALAILVSTFHHGKEPSAIDQKTFGEYTERTSFERPLTSGVAYALKVPHSLREEFEKQHGLIIKKMETEDQTLVQDCDPENLDPAPIQDEYAPVVFAQETVSHIISIDMMSGKEDRENILRARASGKGVLTSPFKLLKSNHLGVVLTFAVYDRELLLDATPKERIDATVGYIGASYDVPSLVDRLLHQLASKQRIAVNVYDTTNKSSPINMYGNEIVDTGLVHVSHVDFGDPLRKHEMHCRFKQKAPWPWTAIHFSGGALVIINLLGYIFYAAINRIAKVEEDYHKMMELKSRAEAADVAKSQFLATVSHEIRTPMNGVLGMLQMLSDTDLDAVQKDFVQTAHSSGKDLILLINEVLDQAKIESGRLELEKVPFDLLTVLDNVLSLVSGKSNEKNIELAVYVSDKVPEVVIGDPVRVRQIITNLVGNSIKFTHNGHILVSVHMAEEVQSWPNVRDKLLRDGLNIADGISEKPYNTLSGSPVVDRRKSWENFKRLNNTNTLDENESVNVLITVEDTGDGIPLAAQSGIFTAFMQADSSTSRNYGGTGIGLSISKSLVDLMHGEIGFVSEPGIGSTFSFSVPFIRCEKNCLDLVSQSYDPVVSDFRGLRALVIDKRSIRAEVTKYHLRRLGIYGETACSLGAACRQLSSLGLNGNWDFSMVLIDKDIWNNQTGLAFNSLLREHWQNKSKETSLPLPKIFLLATSIDSSERLMLKSSGLVDHVVMKPLRSSVLITCFHEGLGNGKKRHERKKPSSLGHLLREKRILVVDDNKVNRRVAEGALKKYGAVVTCVGSGKEALEKLCPPHDFDACFMDLQMPEMDGFEATRQIRAMEMEVNRKIANGEASVEMFRNVSHWHMPILAMTADVIHATNDECIKCGMDDYVAKPFEEEQLYSAVARFFESD